MENVEPNLHTPQNLAIFTGNTFSPPIISAYDNIDPNPTVVIDSNNVDTNIPGNYQVTYAATDIAGNTVYSTLAVAVYNLPPNPDDFIINVSQPGKMILVWFGGGSNGLSLLDNTELFSLNFNLLENLARMLTFSLITKS